MSLVYYTKEDNKESQELSTSEKVAVLLSILGLLVEDVTQLSFQLIYISVLNVTTGNLILAALISTVLAILFTCLFLANRTSHLLIKHGGVLGKGFVFIFSLGGTIPKLARRYQEREMKRRASRRNATSIHPPLGQAGRLVTNPLFRASSVTIPTDIKHATTAFSDEVDPQGEQGDNTDTGDEYLTMVGTSDELSDADEDTTEQQAPPPFSILDLENSDNPSFDETIAFSDCIEDLFEGLVGAIALAIAGCI
eukprot:m.198216 g.198216  ORF g.198216 m.198216 type:complete len:252 (+) comp16833_c0_seq1:3315-4070(+)